MPAGRDPEELHVGLHLPPPPPPCPTESRHLRGGIVNLGGYALVNLGGYALLISINHTGRTRTSRPKSHLPARFRPEYFLTRTGVT
jgi:hypothetical protein